MTSMVCRPAGAVLAGVLCLGWSAGVKADGFNPRQAIEDGLTLEQLRPVIERDIGPIDEKSYVGDDFVVPAPGPTRILMVRVLQPLGGAPFPAVFMFCDRVLFGYSVPVTPAVAAGISDAVIAELPYSSPPENGAWAWPKPDGIEVYFADERTKLSYHFGVGSSGLSIYATYPWHELGTFDFSSFCPNEGEGAADP
jgi:hypothetical protein